MNACTHAQARMHTYTYYLRVSIRKCKTKEETPFFLCFRQSLQFLFGEAVSVLCLVTDFSDYQEQVTEIVFHLFNRT